MRLLRPVRTRSYGFRTRLVTVVGTQVVAFRGEISTTHSIWTMRIWFVVSLPAAGCASDTSTQVAKPVSAAASNSPRHLFPNDFIGGLPPFVTVCRWGITSYLPE